MLSVVIRSKNMFVFSQFKDTRRTRGLAASLCRVSCLECHAAARVGFPLMTGSMTALAPLLSHSMYDDRWAHHHATSP